MKRFSLALCLPVLLSIGACGPDEHIDDHDAAVNPDAAPPAIDAMVVPDAAVQTPEERGEYLVWHVAACIDCHTPFDMNGQLDLARALTGNPVAFDIDPAAGVGLVPGPNLTPHATGLEGWSAEDIKGAFLDGVDRDGNALFPIMPYFGYHNMSAEDADAIVAYLQSLAPVDNAIPDREPLGFPFDTPAQPIPAAMLPDTTLDPADPNYEMAQRGKYLASDIGICLECHTPEAQAPIPRDLTKMYAGGRAFMLGFPPPLPETIYTSNITPDATGIQGWTAAQVRTVLKQGTDLDGNGVCPPMPSGPMGAFSGMTDEDALAIGWYVTTLAPIDNTIPADCSITP